MADIRIQPRRRSRFRISPSCFSGLLAALLLGSTYTTPQTFRIQGTSLDVDLHGNVYVLDAEENTLRLYSKEITLLAEVGGPGWDPGKFDHPAGIWARNGIDVFVADYSNHRIQRFDRGLTFVSSLSTRQNENPDERFGYPTGVALSRLGELFICDTEDSRIVKVDRFNTVERAFGGFGAGKGRLISPRNVALGPGDAIYVLDGGRVAVFDAFGNYLRDVALTPRSRPQALTADEGGIAVLDSEAVVLFNAEERMVASIPLLTVVSAGTDVRALAIGGGMMYLLTGGGLIRIPDPRATSDIENKPISH